MFPGVLKDQLSTRLRYGRLAAFVSNFDRQPIRGESSS